MKNLFLGLLITSLFSFAFAQKPEKLKADEIIAKHLESIGTKEKRAEIKNQMIIGTSEFIILRGGSSKTIGNVVIASESNKLFFGANFNSSNYQTERASFDGNNVNIGFIAPGLRSAFGNYMLSNKQIFSEGLFGGTLSSSWALFDLLERKAKVNTAGRKKIDGKDSYVLEYSPKRGSDSSIKIYFDSQNFQHIRTEYFKVFSAAQGLTPDQSSKQVEARQVLTEDFSSFSLENGLNLPHKYVIHLVLDGRSTSEYEWTFQFSNFLINQKLDAKSFDIDFK